MFFTKQEGGGVRAVLEGGGENSKKATIMGFKLIEGVFVLKEGERVNAEKLGERWGLLGGGRMGNAVTGDNTGWARGW